MKVRFKTRSVTAALAVAGMVVAGAIAPAQAGTRSTVVVYETNAFSSLNSITPDTNLTTNADAAYITGTGFNYYNDHKDLIENKIFGTYKIVKNSAKDFRVAYTVKPGRVWSDGTPINAEDLILSHVLNSNAYSIKAGLGDPNDAKTTPVFNSVNYGGTYDSSIVGLPVLSGDKMTLTLQYKNPVPNWDLYGPGPSPIHALYELANGKTALGTLAENNAAKDAAYNAIVNMDTATLKKMGKVWSNDYNITTIDSSTNPLLLVSNGGFIPTAAVTNQSITFGVNAKYNSGPALDGSVDKVLFRFGFADGTAATQALANGELDIYAGQVTADAVASLKKISGVKVQNATSACYEHIDLRTGKSLGDSTSAKYTGPFSASSPSGLDLRRAFLLAYPRQEIVDKIVSPVNSAAVVPGSTFVLPGQSNYNKVVAINGSSYFAVGTQARRTANALKLVKKWFPSASATHSVVNVTLMVPSNNARRASEAALVVPALAKAGFKVTAAVTSGWGGKLDDASFDAEFYAWCPSAVLQTGTNANFQSDGTNNHMGWNVTGLDAILTSLEKVISSGSVTLKYAAAERLINANALSLAIFQHPAVTAYNAALKNVKTAPLSPNLVWNYWEWAY
jgi:peptide/nickel transport system substrate-binding protein